MAPRLSALVLAAGLSSRMGRLKPLLPLDPKGGQTPLGLCVGLFRAAGMTEVVVVTGHRCDETDARAFTLRTVKAIGVTGHDLDESEIVATRNAAKIFTT